MAEKAKGKEEKVKVKEEKAEANAESKELAEFMEGMAGAGFENLGAQDFQIPFLRILQPLSPQVLDGDEHVENAKAGHFYNTLTNRVYGHEVEIIPLKCVTEWLVWAPNRGPMKARVPVGSIPIVGEPFSKMMTPDGDEVVETMTIYCLIAGHIEEGPVAFPLAKTNIKHGKKLNTMLHSTFLPSGKRAPYFSSVWRLRTSVNRNEKGTWYSLGVKNQTNIDRIRWITQEEFTGAITPALDILKDEQKMKLLGSPQEMRSVTEESAF